MIEHELKFWSEYWDRAETKSLKITYELKTVKEEMLNETYNSFRK